MLKYFNKKLHQNLVRLPFEVVLSFSYLIKFSSPTGKVELA
jgi:hypothetical protein